MNESFPLIFSGSSHESLGEEVASLLGVPLGKRDLHLFPDKEIALTILEEVQGKDVFVLQTLGIDPNFHLMELLIFLDALKRASAKTLTVLMPYYGYARQDRVNRMGEPITAKLVADLLTKAGMNHLVTMDLHSEQIEGFFDVPVQHLLSQKLLIPFCASLKLQDCVVVAPDKGAIKIASAYAKELQAPIALVEKERKDPFHVEMRLFVGDVSQKTVLLVDDLCSTGGTLIHAAQVCKNRGAKQVIAVVGHGLFIGNALEMFEKSSIEMVITTNSVPLSENVQKHSKVRIISIAPLLAEAIRRFL